MALFHITVAMKSFFMILLLNSPLFCQSKVIKKENGLTYITGRGCGTLTPIKHFDSMPTDISELTCAIINSEKIEKSEGKSFGLKNGGKYNFARRKVSKNISLGLTLGECT